MPSSGKRILDGRLILTGCISTFPYDLARVLVVAEADETRMAELAVGCPLGEGELGDELGLDPMDAARRGPGSGPGLERGELPAHAAQRGGIEAGADLAGVGERSVIVVADEQGAETGALALWIGVADDDEFLLVDALELLPVARAPGYVAGVAVIGDDALPVAAAGFGKVAFAVGGAMGGVSEAAVECERALQELLAVAERNRAEVGVRSEEHTSELQSHSFISYA